MVKLEKSNVETFISYLGHQNYWLDVFKPNVNGERPKGLLSTAFFKKKDKKVLIDRIESLNGKGIICLAVNDRKEKDKTIKSINRVHSLLIDIDVKKSFKKGFVSLPEHHEKAIETAWNIKEYLENKNFKVSMIIDSGNGAQMYLYLDEELGDEYIEKRKNIIKEITEPKKQEDKIKELFKANNLSRIIETFEKDLKTQFNYDFIEIDNITKDINRRMKVPGTINKKDENQVEDRVAKIIYYKEDCKYDDRDNYLALSKYEPTPLKIIVSEDNKPIVSGDDSWTLKRLNNYLNSKKEKDKEFKDTYNGKNLDSSFAGDRSSAEQSLVNMLYFRGFRTFEEIDLCMNKSIIGKWKEGNKGYKNLTFNKARDFYNEKIAIKKEKKSSFESSFHKFQIYLLTDEAKSKYLVHNTEDKEYVIRSGKDCLIDYLYPLLQQEKVDLNQLSLYYPESNSKTKNLLLDFIEDSGFIKLINNINFKPFVCDTYKEENKVYYNTYRPTQYLSMTKTEKEIDLSHKCENINFLLLNLTGGDKKGRDYLIKLLAFMVQNPHIKTGKLICFFGAEGAGKGIFYNQIVKTIFERYAVSITQDLLDSPYNGYLSEKLAIYFNEVENKKENSNLLKNWITEPSISINEKYGGQREEKSFFTVFADVNGNNPITAGERRTVYFKSKTLGGSYKKAEEIGQKLVEEIPKEINYLVEYLMNLNVTHKEVREGYTTQAKQDVLDNIKTVEQQFIDLMKEYDSLDNFVQSITEVNSHLQIGEFIKGDWIEIQFLLNCFNSFRKMKGMNNPIVMNKFSWIYDALDFDRENKEEVCRNYNTSGRRVYWLRLSKLMQSFDQVEVIENIN